MKTRRNIGNGKFSVEMQVFGSGEPLLFLHGAGGLFGVDPFLEELGHDFEVYAPHLPGYGESTGAEQIDDVLDAVLFHHELMDDLGFDCAYWVGHSMGGMLAAEAAALDNSRVKKLVLANPAGFWLDDNPIPDFFAAQLDELAPLLFHDPNGPIAKAFTSMPDDFKEIEAMYVERARRLAMASKFLWPVPDRGLRKRAYRIKAPTLVVWGESDRLIAPVYAGEFTSRIGDCRMETIALAGHMPMYEQQASFCRAVREFLKG